MSLYRCIQHLIYDHIQVGNQVQGKVKYLIYNKDRATKLERTLLAKNLYLTCIQSGEGLYAYQIRGLHW